MENIISQILKELTTVSFFAAEHDKSVNWYSDFWEIGRYFKMPGYSEYRISDYQHELGLIDSKFAPENVSNKPTGAIVFWHVNITDRSEGFITASVVAPFGNILGLMQNPHYLEILLSFKK